MIRSDSCIFSVQWKSTAEWIHGSSMSRIFYLRIDPRELLVLSLDSIAYDTKARWFCSLHHPSSTAFVSKNRNHCITCWILTKAGPKVWFPKVLSQWRSWVGLGVCLLKKSASMWAVFLKGVVTLPNSTCCLQKCFLIWMCLVAGLLDGCRPIVIAPLLSQKIVVGFILPNPSCCISIRRLRASFVPCDSAQYSASWELKQAVWLNFTFQLIAAPSKRKI